MEEKMSRCFAVIMAGGSGTRFWPESRKKNPKQLLNLFGGSKPLITQTLERLDGVVKQDDAIIVTGRIIRDGIRKALPGVPAGNILLEPVARNTAPCIGWAAVHVLKKDPAGVMAVLPADHHIADVGAFKKVVNTAIEAAGSGSIITVGINPSRPDTGYGYLRLGSEKSAGVREVEAFVEKPDASTAQKYLDAGNYAWNSGMFFFKAEKILAEIKTHMPDLHRGLMDIGAVAGTDEEAAVVEKVFPTLPEESIDYGIMEKASGICAVTGEFGWSDVGSWEAAWELAGKDDEGNSIQGECIVAGSKGCMLRSSSGKTVALVGLEDVVVVETGDALLVCRRTKSQDVKKVVNELKAQDRKDLL